MNRGILEAHAAGVVSSVSVLVNTPGWEEAAAALRGAGASLGAGLHLNLTVGEPVSATGAPTLVSGRTGRFRALAALVARALAGRIDPADVAAECAAQLARLRDAGVRVTHLDSHRHIHLLPGVWRPVVETARRSGVAVVRVPLEPPGAARAGWRPRLKRAVLAAALRVSARATPVPRHADRFYGMSLQGAPDLPARLLALLDGLEPGTTELMVHPGYPDPTLERWDAYTAPRAAELAALTAPPVRARFRSGAFRLVDFGTP